MVKYIVFAGSASTTSINKQLVQYAADLVKAKNADIEIELVDFTQLQNLQLFGTDVKAASGTPKEVEELVAKFKTADKFIFAASEHNQNVTAVYKNFLDWASQLEGKVYNNKPLLLLGTSPGAWGGRNASRYVKDSHWYFGADVFEKVFNLGGFYDNFKEGKIVNEESNAQLVAIVDEFVAYEGKEPKAPF